MAKKNFDNLVNNVIGTPATKQSSPTPSQQEETSPVAETVTVEEVEKEQKTVHRGRPVKNVEATENFCGRADSVKLAKIRTVAEKENIPIKDLYNLAFDLFIQAYEEKHGTIRVKAKQSKGDVNSLI